MKSTYLKERTQFVSQKESSEELIFTEDLVSSLPEPIKKYLDVCGYMNSPVPINADIHWQDSYFKMSPEKEWGQINTLQFNSVKPLARVAYMKFSSMPISARDIYNAGYGEMKVKLFNIFKLAFENSQETAQSALITSFAEFLLIPGYFILDSVIWETINDTTVRATLTDSDIEVSGLFFFDNDGYLSRFETDDRYYSLGKNNYKKIKYSGVVDSYKEQGNIKIPENVKAIWHLPEGDYEYFKSTIEKIDYNIGK